MGHTVCACLLHLYAFVHVGLRATMKWIVYMYVGVMRSIKFGLQYGYMHLMDATLYPYIQTVILRAFPY